MEQFIVHDLFADDFTAHQPPAPVLNHQTQSISTHTHNAHNDFNFLSSTDNFLQTTSSELFPSSFSAQPQPSSTSSVHITKQNSLFNDDHHFNVNVQTDSVLSQAPQEHTVNDNDDLLSINNSKPDSHDENGIVKVDEPIPEPAVTMPNILEMTTINNVVSIFNTRSHLNLKRVATEGANVIYKRENNMVNMKLRRPKATASIWSSGKITCTGTESEADAHKASRRIARALQKMGFRVRFANYKVVNVLGTCFFPFAIDLNSFSAQHRHTASYEPELHPGVTFKLKDPKATIKIFSTGSITVTAPSVANVHASLRHIFPLVHAHKLAKGKLNPREIELTEKYLANNAEASGRGRHKRDAQAAGFGQDRSAAGDSQGSGGGGGGPGAHMKSGYAQFRYKRRLAEEEEEDSYGSESSYGEDSEFDEGD